MLGFMLVNENIKKNLSFYRKWEWEDLINKKTFLKPSLEKYRQEKKKEIKTLNILRIYKMYAGH